MYIPLTPIRCLYRGADLYADKIGVISTPNRFTYAQFAARCEQLASGLKQEGVSRGDRVAFLSFNTNQLLEGYFGPLLIRAIAMPLNVRLTPSELIQILNHSGAKILLFENDFAPLAAAFRKTCPCIRRYVAIDGP
ncbi:MAG: AMP-binding protein, partial [Acidobacteriaceae bacterium]|nr:AMP-binding protein [Acidobacteriaceae bacterium]